MLNQIKKNVTRIERARIIKRTLGTYIAARFMRGCGFSIEAALHVLASK